MFIWFHVLIVTLLTYLEFIRCVTLCKIFELSSSERQSQFPGTILINIHFASVIFSIIIYIYIYVKFPYVLGTWLSFLRKPDLFIFSSPNALITELMDIYNQFHSNIKNGPWINLLSGFVNHSRTLL